MLNNLRSVLTSYLNPIVVETVKELNVNEGYGKETFRIPVEMEGTFNF